MELFSLGEGHYTEKDVTEAARALTGWSLDRLTEKFIYRPLFHDNGVKTFLGRTGNLDGDDVMAQIVAQPQAARFITAKLWNYFAGQPPSDESERRARRRVPRERKQFQAVPARHVSQRGILRRRHHPQPGEKPGAMAGRQRADAGMRSAADARSARPSCAVSDRTCSRRRTSKAGTAASPGSPPTRCWPATTTRRRSCKARSHRWRLLISRANRAGRAAPKLNARLQRVRIGGVNVDKIVTPEERADKDLLVAVAGTPAVANDAQGRTAKGVARFSRHQNKIGRRGHPDRHPAGHVHAGISSDVKTNKKECWRTGVMECCVAAK